MMKGKGGREKVGFFLSLFQTSAFAEEEKGWREGEREKYVFSPFSPAAPLSKSGPIFHVSAFPPSAAKEEKASTRRHRVLLLLQRHLHVLPWAEGNRRQSLAVLGTTGRGEDRKRERKWKRKLGSEQRAEEHHLSAHGQAQIVFFLSERIPPSLALSVPSPSSPILIPSFLLVKEKGEEEGQSAKRGGGGWGEKLVPEDTRKGGERKE